MFRKSFELGTHALKPGDDAFVAKKLYNRIEQLDPRGGGSAGFDIAFHGDPRYVGGAAALPVAIDGAPVGPVAGPRTRSWRRSASRILAAAGRS